MIALPAQETALYFILSLIVALLASLLAVLTRKSKTLDEMQKEFSKKELSLNKKLYETSVLKSKLEAMVESMTEGVLMLDKDLKLIVINPACKRLLGLEGRMNITIFDVVRSFSKHYPIEETISQVFEMGRMRRVSEVKVGDQFFQITVIPIEVAEGVPGVGVLIHDQSEEQNLRHKHEEFLAMVVHELRSPLTVIKGMNDLLLREVDNMEKSKRDEIFTQMKDSAISLLDIVNTLLDDTKMDLAKFDIDKHKNDINLLLKNEIENYNNLADEKGVRIKMLVDKTIPEFDFDKAKITQVLNNLLSNALKFTKEGSVTVSSELEKMMVKIIVADTGAGVPDNKKDQLFQKFMQLDNSKKADGPGTGLGLVIAKGIVEAHGGEVWIEDNKPQGAKFIFTLPI